MEGNKVYYSFYKKSISTPFVIMEKAALSWDSKPAILSHEKIRRGLHFHEGLPKSKQTVHYRQFEEMMINSGYSWT